MKKKCQQIIRKEDISQLLTQCYNLVKLFNFSVNRRRGRQLLSIRTTTSSSRMRIFISICPYNHSKITETLVYLKISNNNIFVDLLGVLKYSNDFHPILYLISKYLWKYWKCFGKYWKIRNIPTKMHSKHADNIVVLE